MNNMKTATYHLLNGEMKEVHYDPNGTCTICDLPIIEASMGGTTICPWCDCGMYRDGTRWQTINEKTIRIEAKIRSTYNLNPHGNQTGKTAQS